MVRRLCHATYTSPVDKIYKFTNARAHVLLTCGVIYDDVVYFLHRIKCTSTHTHTPMYILAYEYILIWAHIKVKELESQSIYTYTVYTIHTMTIWWWGRLGCMENLLFFLLIEYRVYVYNIVKVNDRYGRTFVYTFSYTSI